MSGAFVRDYLPDWLTYADREGLVLIGRSKWKTTRCDFHGGSDSMRVNTETNGWCCMACGAKGGDVLAHYMQRTGTDFIDAARVLGSWQEDGEPDRDNRYRPGKAINRPVAPLKRETLSEYGTELFAACTGLPCTIGEQYVLARGGVIPPADGDLRFHPALRHPSGYTGPALVALVTHAATRAPLTLHQTWICADGRKADVDPPRMLLGGHTKRHGVIRLWPDEAVTTGLAIAEGIETALSLAHVYMPVWSLIDAGNLAAFPSLGGIETLVIGADHDDAGIKAATACADRWAAGADVRVIAPEAERADWNDARAAA